MSNDVFVSTMVSVMATIVIIYSIALIIGIIMYIFESIGLYSISKRRNLGTAAFAWIPVLNMIQLGKIADDARFVADRKVTYYKAILPVFVYGGSLLAGIGVSSAGINLASLYTGYGSTQSAMSASAISLILMFVGWGVFIAGAVFEYICLYYLYRSCSTSYVAMLVLSIIFSVLIPFFVFAVRHNDNPEFYNRNKGTNGTNGYRQGPGPVFAGNYNEDTQYRQVADDLWEGRSPESSGENRGNF